MEKEEEVDKIRSGITILKSAQRYILPAQLGQMKTEMMEMGLLQSHR